MRATLRPMAVAAALLVGAVCLLLLLNQAQLASTFDKRTRDRHLLLADDLAKTLEAQLALGLSIEDTPSTRAVLTRTLTHAPGLRALAVLGTDGKPRLAAGAGQPALWQQARTTADRQGFAASGEMAVIALRLRNAFEAPAGWLALEYSLDGARTQTRQAFSELWPATAAALAVALLGLALLGPSLRRSAAGDTDRHARRLTLAVMALLLGIQVATAWTTYQAFTRIAREDAPVLAAAMARTITPAVERALDQGIALHELRGVADWLRPLLGTAPEFHGLRLQDAQGQPLFAVSAAGTGNDRLAEHRFVLSPRHDGELVVTLDLAAIGERSRQLAIEFVTLLLAGTLLVFSVLKGLGPSSGATETARLGLPLFLYFLGSELPRAFLPVWARALSQQVLPAAWDGLAPAAWLAPLSSLPPALLASLPISLFLLAVALTTLWAGRFSARHGPRRLIWLGLALALAGHIVAFGAGSWLSLCLARVLAGMSFGCVSLAAFDYIGRHATQRARGMAQYLGAYVAAGICGTGIGGLTEDRAGIPAVFLLGMLCSVTAGLAMRWLPALPARAGTPGPKRRLLHDFALLLHQPRFLQLLVLLALPMQIVQQGLLFYWLPLTLAGLGERTSFVGLAMMGYFVMVLLFNQPSARRADRTGQHQAMVVAALVLAGIAGLLGGALPQPAVIAGGALLIGLAWACGFPALGAQALQVSQHGLTSVEPAVALGLYRTVERVGAMLAPLLAAGLMSLAGPARAALGMGGLLIVCALVQTWISRGRTT